MKKIIAFTRLARPKQWVKNVFVLTVLIFSGKLLDINAVIDTFTAVLCFCFASSATYCLNDFRDIKEDSNHPLKKTRPLASGQLPRWSGLAGFALFLAASFIIAYLQLNSYVLFILALYLGLNIAYSAGLKHIVILDVLCISAGFVLRILAGAAALSVIPSTWLILCAVTLSLFLGFTKRRAEVVLLGENASSHRKVLSDYNTLFLDQVISTVTAATIVSYALYTVDARTVELVGSKSLVLSIPFALYGIFRYLYLVYHVKSGGDPTKTIFTDIPLLITGTLWGAISSFIILNADFINKTIDRFNAP